MNKRRRVCFSAAILAVPLVYLFARYSWLRLRGEHFYLGRPSSYWSRQIKEFEDQKAAWAAPWPDRVLHRLGAFRGDVSQPAVLTGGQTAIPVLVDLLKENDVHVRYYVSGYLSSRITPFPYLGGMKSDSDGIVAALVQALRENSPFDRRPMIQVLGELGSKTAVPALTDLLRAEDLSTRSAAAEALAKIGPSVQEERK